MSLLLFFRFFALKDLPHLSFVLLKTSQMSDLSEHVHFFVYGTLMLGEVRETCWPSSPVSVHPAKLSGALLFDWNVGYPAIVSVSELSENHIKIIKKKKDLPEEGRVIQGECWCFHRRDEQKVLEVLDSIEGFNPRKPTQSLYHRKKASVKIEMIKKNVDAWYYVYGTPASLLTPGREFEYNSEEGGKEYVRWSPRQQS